MARRESIAERRERRGAVDDVGTVLEAAARMLETRSRSIAEVRRRLTSAGYPAALVEKAITRLVELGLLDDHAFAAGWVQSRDRTRPRGEHALRHELESKGVDQALIDETLGERADASVEADLDVDRARRLIERRLPSLMREADPRRRRQKAYALLARNGFPPDVAADVSTAVVGDD
jgi:regulatory protein